MVILGIDLAWNTSGWALYDTCAGCILAYGLVSPPESPDKPKQLQLRGQRLQQEWAALIAKHQPDIVAYEYTDWLQQRSEYGRERRAIGGLKRAEITLLLAWPAPVFAKIGAKEVKKAYSAQRKDAIARYVAAEFEQFTFETFGEDWFLVDQTGNRLSADESDAIAVARAWWLVYGKAKVVEQPTLLKRAIRK